MAVAIHLALAFIEEGEPIGTQGLKSLTLLVFKHLADLTLGSTVDPRVGDRRFPLSEVFVLFVEAVKRTPFERIVLGVLHARLDLAFVSRHVRFGGQNYYAVMLAERFNLWVELWFVPIWPWQRRRVDCRSRAFWEFHQSAKTRSPVRE